MIKILGIVAAATGMAAVMLAGCTPQSKQAYTAAGHDLGKAAEETGQGIQQDLHKAGDEMDNDATSARVQQGLVSDKSVNISNLKVDTGGKTVTIQGTVPSPDQKSRSTDIAKEKAGAGFIIVNKIRVNN